MYVVFDYVVTLGLETRAPSFLFLPLFLSSPLSLTTLLPLLPSGEQEAPL